MSYQSTVFSQVFAKVNRLDFKNQVTKHNGEQGASKFQMPSDTRHYALYAVKS